MKANGEYAASWRIMRVVESVDLIHSSDTEVVGPSGQIFASSATTRDRDVV